MDLAHGFVGRELMDPSNVMHPGAGQSSLHLGGVDNSLAFLQEIEASASTPGLKEGEVDLGTTIMAVAYDGGVVMGADSRTSTGSYIANRVTNKVTRIDEQIYVCRSGSAADTQAISDYVKYFLDNHRMEYGQAPKVATAASLFQQLCYNNKSMLMAAIVVAGWDKVKGGQVYSIPLGGALVPEKFTIGGSGSSYIYGFCDSYYQPNMTREQTEEFVVKAISHAMGRDGSSGGCVRLVTIHEGGVDRKFFPGNKLPFGPL